MGLNDAASEMALRMIREAAELQIEIHSTESGTTLIDCGIHAAGSLAAGLQMAEICLGGLGAVRKIAADPQLWQGDAIEVTTEHPLAACMASQYAGWKIEASNFFAMGSGPMRASGSREALFDKIGLREKADVAVGVLETRKFPTDEVCRQIAESCGVALDRLTLLVAPTASLAGNVQIVARSVETALHKLHELEFDLNRIQRGRGIAPLPPVAGDDLSAIGRTNDAILYGSQVTLWVDGDDADLDSIGPQVPSSASPAHGEPFREIFKRHQGDFYAIDPMLFSPAVVIFKNESTGLERRFGRLAPDVLARWFTG